MNRRIRRLLGFQCGSMTPSKVDETYAWQKAAADIYCSFGASDYTGKLAAWCRAVKRPLILFSGSDQDFCTDYRPDSEATNIYGSRADLCYQALMYAHVIVLQTQTQARLLAERFGRTGVVVPNPIDLNGLPATPLASRRFALWIGKSDTVKCPELVIDLARLCSEVPFKVVLNRANPAIFDRIMDRIQATRLLNLEVIEQVSPDAISPLYQEAFALLNTSRFEGFPNTFLEAGKHAVPVLSLSVDPDGIIARHDAGVTAGGDMTRLADAVRWFHSDPNTVRLCGANMREYVRHHHALRNCIALVDTLLQKVMTDGHPS